MPTACCLFTGRTHESPRLTHLSPPARPDLGQRPADEVFEDAWRHYVVFHIDTVMAWCDAKERVEPFGLRVIT
jgi:hypothetical protein